MNSSQALCIDVFGSLKTSHNVDDIIGELLQRLGFDNEGGPWQIDLEWSDPQNHLNLREKRRTQVDVTLRNERYLIFAECKFTELDGGSCSRPLPKREHWGQAECNGDYDWQADPIRYALFSHYGIAVTDAKCALTRAGIRYWEYVPEVLRINPERIYRPCPFKASLYQWMRNIVLCWRVASRSGLRPILLVVYAYAPGLPMSDRVRSKEWDLMFSVVRQDRISVHTMSYQELIRIAMVASGHHKPAFDRWVRLEQWVQRKVDRAVLMLKGKG